MTVEAKISPAFSAFLSESGPNDRRDAIVIYEVPALEDSPDPTQLWESETRQKYLKERIKVQKSVAAELFETYKTAGAERLPDHQPPAVSKIGSGALPIATVEVTRRTLPALAKHPSVVAILPNQKIQLIRPSAIAYDDLNRQEAKQGITWGLQQLGIPDLWAYSKGANINVAVLDTGVFSEHPALQDRVKDFVVIDPMGRRITADPPFDSGQHGTHVCGIIAGGKTPEGVAIGVAPEANLLAANVMIGEATLQTLMEGISWAVEKGAHVLNLSLGFMYYEPKFARVFELLQNQFNILPVVAIGNEAHGNSRSPGNAYSAFSVGAVERMSHNRLDVASFSSGASLVFPGQTAYALVTKPDVVAPGTQVYSCIPPQDQPDGSYYYTYMDGTSMAAPHVAGVVALLMAIFPKMPVTKILQVLKDTAKHPDGERRRPDNRWGYGLIQPLEALQALKHEATPQAERDKSI